jgi:hypothetical protein
MDPKSPLFKKTLPTSEVIRIIDEWVERGNLYYWNMSPEELKNEIPINGIISYGEFSKIIAGAKTSKMIGCANRGLEYFKQEFKRLVK